LGYDPRFSQQDLLSAAAKGGGTPDAGSPDAGSPDPGLAKTTSPAVINAVLKGKRNDKTPVSEAELRERWSRMSDAEKRELQMAARLDARLRANERSGNRDDAKTYADGVQIIADAHIRRDANGKETLDKQGFMKDLAKYSIDQKKNPSMASPYGATPLSAKILHGVGESAAGRELMGGERLGSRGWRSDYMENPGAHDLNQAHHASAFVVASMQYGEKAAMAEAKTHDAPWRPGTSQGDVRLSRAMANVGAKINSGEINPRNIGGAIYSRIKK
jgi:hypothetical protein